MAADASIYATLGVAPGADWPAIERAYKEQIKRYHPDRAGGDAKRAAEIIHAYRELKRARDRKGALVLIEEAPPRRGRTGWLWPVLAAAAAGLLAFVIGPLKPVTADQAVTATPGRSEEAMDAELDGAAINGAVSDAVRLFRDKDEMALASASRDCHRQLRDKPSLGMLDRCAAFDDAVVMLQDRDPLRSQGPFSELAVTSRQLNAGRMMSSDALAIDGRLDRIRLQAELALAPPALPLPPPLSPEKVPEDVPNEVD